MCRFVGPYFLKDNNVDCVPLMASASQYGIVMHEI